MKRLCNGSQWIVLILVLLIFLAVPTVSTEGAQSTIPVKPNSPVIGEVFWMKTNQNDEVALLAVFGVKNSQSLDIKWDNIGYTVIPNWTSFRSIPRKDYVREVITTPIGERNDQGELHNIPANVRVPIAVVVIPMNEEVIKPHWDRELLGAMIVLSFKSEPVFIGITRLPSPEEIKEGKPSVTEVETGMVTMQTYLDGRDADAPHQTPSTDSSSATGVGKRLPQQLRNEVKAQMQTAKALSQDNAMPPINIAILVFDNVRQKNPNLTDDQLFEVASIIGNAMKMNAKYFMLYKDGIPEEGRVIENPGFDFRDTTGNIPD